MAKCHKLIYKFTDSLSELLNDAKMATGEDFKYEVVGTAVGQAMFTVKQGSKESKIAGLSVKSGEIERNLTYRVKRHDYVIMEDLKVESLK